MENFDIVVVGAGPGGYVSAIRSAQLGLKTALVEQKALGGVCLNIGCIPSKALLRNAELAYLLRTNAESYGIRMDNLSLDYSAAYKRSRQVSQRLIKGVGFLMKKHGISVFNGRGFLLSASEVRVEASDGSNQTLGAKNIILATGAHPAVVPGMEPDGEKILDYAGAIMLERLPKSALIIGGGAVGVEFATIWSAYGVEVHLVEMLPHILPAEDEEAAAELTKAFARRGVKVHAGTKVLGVEKIDRGTRVSLSNEVGEQSVETDLTLVAVGFKPNSSDLGLEALGVGLDQRGFVVVDGQMRTNVPGVRAIGDLTGKLLLAHTASTMGILCAESIAGLPTRELDYRMIPRATYSQPQVASFGYSEAQAVQAGFSVKLGKFPFQANGKALGYGEYGGYVKLIANAENDLLLGASIVGPDAAELLPELTLAQANGLPVSAIAANIHAHPTLNEAVMEAAEAVEGHAIHI
ncbi:MAG: dihydrolipoyl dehydrogenase [Anaerolineaceae bacterium]